MKTKEELNELRKEVETLNTKLGELTGEELAQVFGGSDYDLKLITPGSIESNDKLKDASATSVFGTRSGNGVILITSMKEEN